jgi:hypothetical protein
MAVTLLAAAWGLAEATLFFLVPDILITWVALTSLRRALLSSLWVLAGALAGGCLMHLSGASRPDQALT